MAAKAQTVYLVAVGTIEFFRVWATEKAKLLIGVGLMASNTVQRFSKTMRMHPFVQNFFNISDDSAICCLDVFDMAAQAKALRVIEQQLLALASVRVVTMGSIFCGARRSWENKTEFPKQSETQTTPSVSVLRNLALINCFGNSVLDIKKHYPGKAFIAGVSITPNLRSNPGNIDPKKL